MKKLLFIVFLLVLGCQIIAQQKNLVVYPFRVINVDCIESNQHRSDYPQHFFIQTESEFYKICGKKNYIVNFDNEIVLGAIVRTGTRYTDKKNISVPYFSYSVMQEQDTRIIHFTIIYPNTMFTQPNDILKQAWVAIPKQKEDSEIHISIWSGTFGGVKGKYYLQVLKSGHKNYEFREISVDCEIQQFSSDDSVFCYFVQTQEEFDFLCDNKITKSFINFSNELIIGLKVLSHWNNKLPNFRYITQDIETGIIHIMCYFDDRIASRIRNRKPDDPIQSWYTVKKPEADYEIHLHFVGWNENKTMIFKNF